MPGTPLQPLGPTWTSRPSGSPESRSTRPSHKAFEGRSLHGERPAPSRHVARREPPLRRQYRPCLRPRFHRRALAHRALPLRPQAHCPSSRASTASTSPASRTSSWSAPAPSSASARAAASWATTFSASRTSRPAPSSRTRLAATATRWTSTPPKPDTKEYARFEAEFRKDLRYGRGESYGIPYRILTPRSLENVPRRRPLRQQRPQDPGLHPGHARLLHHRPGGRHGGRHQPSSRPTHTRGFAVDELLARLKAMGAHLPNFAPGKAAETAGDPRPPPAWHEVREDGICMLPVGRSRPVSTRAPVHRMWPDQAHRPTSMRRCGRRIRSCRLWRTGDMRLRASGGFASDCPSAPRPRDALAPIPRSCAGLRPSPCGRASPFPVCVCRKQSHLPRRMRRARASAPLPSARA